MTASAPSSSARRLALDLLRRVDGGAYANLVVPAALKTSGLDSRDRHLVTELVYGTTRMRRACDFLVDRFLVRTVDPDVRAALRLGAYQLYFMRVPAHAAVAETVSLLGGPARGLLNAVLRRVATSVDSVEWPDDATRLSYPDWIVARVTSDLGREDGLAALVAMNEPAAVTERRDGYIQDQASQWVAELVGAQPGERVADLCAAPGGKATAVADAGATVAAVDVNPTRSRLVKANAARLGLPSVLVVAADGRRPPFPDSSFDRVLVDAPCSGLGVLSRRPDARWRIDPHAVGRLAGIQRQLVHAAARLVRPGGTVVYSVCTVTAEEALGVDDYVATTRPELSPDPPGAPWEPWGRGGRLLPHQHRTDGMAVFRYERHI